MDPRAGSRPAISRRRLWRSAGRNAILAVPSLGLRSFTTSTKNTGETMHKMITVAFIACLPSGLMAADRYSELLAKLPDSANALVMVDAKAAFSSPVAVRETGAQRKAATHAGMMAISPAMDVIVIGSQFDLATLRP